MLLLLFLILIFWILVFKLPPTVTIGDVAELTGAASTLGIAHSPGYPLFCNLYKIFTTIFPFGDYGYRTAVGSLILYILTGFVIFKFFKKNSNILLAWFSILFFFSQEILLNQSIVGEVFALHNLLYVIIIYFMFSDSFELTKKLFIVAFLFGLSIGNQHVIIFILPATIIWFLYLFYKSNRKVNLKWLFLTLLFFILGFSIYIYIPIRSLQEPLYDWEDPQTIDRFIYLFTRGRYGTFSLAQGGKLQVSFENLISSIKMFLYIIGPKNIAFLTIIFFILIFNLKKFNKENLLKIGVIFINILSSGVFLIFMSGLKSPSSNNIYILERLITTAVVSIVFLVGMSFMFVKNTNIIYAAILVNFVFLFFNFTKINLKEDFFLYDYTNNIFANTPIDSILISDRADETEFCIVYFQRLFKKRRDISFIDANASVTKSIYGENYYRIWGIPRLEIRSKIEQKIVSTSNRKVFYNTVLPNQTDIKKYKFGILYSTRFSQEQIPYEIFLIRNLSEFNYIREKFLYLTYIELLGSYYIEFDNCETLIQRIYKELFLLTNEIRYLNFIPYYYYSKGKYLEALEEYENLAKYAIEDREFYSEILVNLSVVYQKLGNYKDAEKYLLEAMKINPNNPQIYYNFGILYWRQNNFHKSLNNFEKYLELVPQDIQVKKYIEDLKKKL